MFLYCPLLREIRIEAYKILKDTVVNYTGVESCKDSFSAKEDIVHLIVDCRKFSHLFDDEEIVWNIEKLSKTTCTYQTFISKFGWWLPGTCHLI